MTNNEIIELIENLCEELEEREAEDSYVYDYKGKRITTDTAYAFEGIYWFIDELKHKLKEKK